MTFYSCSKLREITQQNRVNDEMSQTFRRFIFVNWHRRGKNTILKKNAKIQVAMRRVQRKQIPTSDLLNILSQNTLFFNPNRDMNGRNKQVRYFLFSRPRKSRCM